MQYAPRDQQHSVRSELAGGSFRLDAPPETLDDDPPLRDLLTGRLVGVTLDADLGVAARLLADLGVRHLPAMVGEQCYGLVFEHDVLGELVRPTSMGGKPVLVADLYRRVPELRPTDRRSRAAQRMTQTGLDAVIVADHDALLGVVTATDLIGSLAGTAPRAGSVPHVRR